MNEFVQKWLDTHYKKYLMKNPPLESSVYDHIMDWFQSPECGQEYLHKLDRIPVPVAIQLSNKCLNKKNMKNNNETEALNQAIIKLNHKRVYELQLLKEQFQIAYESLKPINIIKNKHSL